jgi:hypothetical protein
MTRSSGKSVAIEQNANGWNALFTLLRNNRHNTGQSGNAGQPAQ